MLAKSILLPCKDVITPYCCCCTLQEDEELKRAVAVHGDKRWSQISTYLSGRTSKACSHRWGKLQQQLWQVHVLLLAVQSKNCTATRQSLIYEPNFKVNNHSQPRGSKYAVQGLVAGPSSVCFRLHASPHAATCCLPSRPETSRSSMSSTRGHHQ
jgi:hypothetical protein